VSQSHWQLHLFELRSTSGYRNDYMLLIYRPYYFILFSFGKDGIDGNTNLAVSFTYLV
jgi:hypothetical protein